MAAVVLVEPGAEVSGEIRSRQQALGMQVHEASSLRDGLRFVEAPNSEVEALVFGEALRDPVQAVQRLYSIAPETPVVVVAGEQSSVALSRALRFSPFVSPWVRCAGATPARVVLELERALADYRRRRRHRATLATLNDQLGVANEPRNQRMASEVLGRLLDVAPIGIVTADEAGVISACNAKAASILESSERDALGTRLTDWFEGFGEEEWAALVRASKASPAERILRRAREGRSPGHVQATAAPVSNRPGERGMLVVLNDVSERMEAEAARDDLLIRERSARLQAEQSNRAKDEFLSVVSHELRTPLNSILGWVQLLRSAALDGAKRERGIDVIHRNARAQAQLIEDLLDVSRIASGKLRLSLQRVALPAMVEMAVEVVRPSAEAKGVALVQALDPDAGELLADPDRLQQVVWNLLANAVKFTPSGGRVEVSLRRTARAVQIEVRDTGRGISAEFLPHVFERFRQEDASATRAHGGLGLGLAIVHHLVGLHGGSVSVTSSPGQGATFTVELPLTSALETTQARGADVVAEKVPLAARELEGLQALVVDDEPDARDMIATLLEEAGAVVATAGSVVEALDALDRGRPALLVSDIGMPSEDGLSLIQRVRQRPAARGGRVPAVALSAYTRPEDRTRALRAGFDAHVSKPLDAAELLAVVARLTGRSH